MTSRVFQIYVLLLVLIVATPVMAAEFDVPQPDWGLEEVGVDDPATQAMDVIVEPAIGEASGPPTDLLAAVKFGVIALATSGEGVNLLAITGAR